MLTFRELAQAMAIDDAVMVRHIDALLRDFVDERRTLFGFWGELPTESALSEAGWRWFRDGHLRLHDDKAVLPRLELVEDNLSSRGIARRQNQRLVKRYESMQDTGAIDPFFSMIDP